MGQLCRTISIAEVLRGSAEAITGTAHSPNLPSVLLPTFFFPNTPPYHMPFALSRHRACFPGIPTGHCLRCITQGAGLQGRRSWALGPSQRTWCRQEETHLQHPCYRFLSKSSPQKSSVSRRQVLHTPGHTQASWPLSPPTFGFTFDMST